jgi:hypothetical protein
MYRHASCVRQSVDAVLGGSLVAMRALLAQIAGVRFCRVAVARFNPVWAGAKSRVMRSGDCTKPEDPNQPTPVAGSRPNAHRVEPRRWKAILTGILTVVGVCVMSFAGSAAPASAAMRMPRSVATAYWSITDSCVVTTVSLEGTQVNSDPPTTAFFLNQEQTCEDPNSVKPVLTLQGSSTGGQLTVSKNFTAGQLAATVPVTCDAYEIGACDQVLYNPGSVSLNLSWTSTGKTLRTREDGMTCLTRYGTATGSILLGGNVNLLATDSGTLPADTTETNVKRCVR